MKKDVLSISNIKDASVEAFISTGEKFVKKPKHILALEKFKFMMGEVKNNIYKNVTSKIDQNDFDKQISEVHSMLKKIEEVRIFDL